MKINDFKTTKKPRIKEAIDPESAAKKPGMGYFDYSTLKREDFNDDDWYVWDPEQQQFVASYGARSSTALDFRMRESFGGTYKMPDGKVAMRGMRAKFMPGIESRSNDNLDEAAKTLQMIDGWEEFKETAPALKEVRRRRQTNASMMEVKQRLDPKCWKGKHKEGTKIKGGVRVNNCVPNESVEEAANAAQQAAIAINMKKHHKKPKHEDVEEGWDDIKKFGKKAAVAGAIGLGALGSAHAQDSLSGEDMLPSIVAHVTFKVDGTTITKDINLGTTFKSPGQAGDALAKFLKSKGIKYYDYSLERVKPNEPLVTPDEMKASNQEYDRRQNADNLDATPLKDKGDSKAGRMDPDSGYTSPPSRYSKAKDYMTKD
jgi:hypothetical protein